MNLPSRVNSGMFWLLMLVVDGHSGDHMIDEISFDPRLTLWIVRVIYHDFDVTAMSSSLPSDADIGRA